jgi:hypothetical protein
MGSEPRIREVNETIRAVAGRFHDLDLTVGFFCECGCLGRVQLTLAAFDAARGSVRSDGHPDGIELLGSAA